MIFCEFSQTIHSGLALKQSKENITIPPPYSLLVVSSLLLLTLLNCSLASNTSLDTPVSYVSVKLTTSSFCCCCHNTVCQSHSYGAQIIILSVFLVVFRWSIPTLYSSYCSVEGYFQPLAFLRSPVRRSSLSLGECKFFSVGSQPRVELLTRHIDENLQRKGRPISQTNFSSVNFQLSEDCASYFMLFRFEILAVLWECRNSYDGFHTYFSYEQKVNLYPWLLVV